MGAQGKGCISCKARRVKCDEAHPKCQRCQKAGLSCKGYNQFKWVDEKPRVKQTLATARAQEEEHLAIRKSSSSNSLYHSSQMKNTQSYLPPRSIPQELSSVIFKQSILFSYLVGKLSEGRTSLLSRDSSVERKGWIERIYSESNNTSNALNALAAIIFGQAHHSMSIIEEGRQSYAKAISSLRFKLLDSSKIENFDTLASVTALCMYELLDRRSETAWNHHADALSHLIQTRGPSQCQNYPEKGVFAEQRTIVVLKAIFSRHGTFLSQPMWKTVPWQNDPSSKEPPDYLVDILSDVTVYQEEVHRLETMTRDRVLNIKDQVSASLQELDCWWKIWQCNNPESCQEYLTTSENTFTKDASGIVFTALLHYDKLGSAYTVCTYNATRILILRILQEISETGDKTTYPTSYDSEANIRLGPNSKQAPLLGITSDIVGLAHEILRSIEYINIQTHQYMASFTQFYLLDIAYSALDPRSREAKWFLSKMASPIGSSYEKDSMRHPGNILPSCRFNQTILPSCRFVKDSLPAA